MISSAPFSALPTAWLELPDGALHWLRGRCIVGRQEDSDLVLAGHTVSRQHALLAPAAAGYSVTDLHSSNGTYVNGNSAARPIALHDGDEIRIGAIVLRFRCTKRIELTAPDAGAPAVTHRLEDVPVRVCWLLVADVAGYSTLSEQLGGEIALRRLQIWIAAVRPLVEKNGGLINGYLGDAIFAFWRCDTATPAHVLAALQGLAAYLPQSPLPFRVVVHHGAVLFTRSEKGEELTGPDVNFVFRSEKIAKRFGAPLMLSEPAVQSLALAAGSNRLGESAVDGMSGIHAFFAPREPAGSGGTSPAP